MQGDPTACFAVYVGVGGGVARVAPWCVGSRMIAVMWRIYGVTMRRRDDGCGI
jgi:hypothetical protein